ncbi:MAG: YitT family protein [Bacilli bacterium]|nr:YitT family protein [Bacilli bacterium]
MFLKKEVNPDEVVREVYKDTRWTRYTSFLIGTIIVAITYNVFLLPCEVVYGVGGLGVILKKLYGIDPFLVILISSILLLILSYFLLGPKKTSHSVVGSLLYPVLVKLTEWIPQYVDLKGAEPLLLIALAAALTGFGLGLIFKAGFTTGGTDILNQIVSKYGKMSIGKAMIFTDGLVIILSGVVFGFIKMIYSMLAMYVLSMISDKVIIGISQSKAFYVITCHETDVKRFIMQNLSHGVTVFDVRGGFTGNHQKMIMFIVPTKEYFFAKEGISKIDPKAFFVVTDAYEVSGGE